MNNGRRKRLDSAIDYLNKALVITEDVRNEEEEAMDNLPENMQMSDRYDAMESAVNSLEDAISSIDEAITSIEEASA